MTAAGVAGLDIAWLGRCRTGGDGCGRARRDDEHRGPGGLWGRRRRRREGGRLDDAPADRAQLRRGYGWIMRDHANGPKAAGPRGALMAGSIVTFSHSSGTVLPCTTMRWKLGTLYPVCIA